MSELNLEDIIYGIILVFELYFIYLLLPFILTQTCNLCKVNTRTLYFSCVLMSNLPVHHKFVGSSQLA